MSAALGQLTAALADRYRIERELGQGGMATVYLAEDLKHHRNVAIKVLIPELAAALGTERFLREITLTARLDHPHILPLLDSGLATVPTDRHTIPGPDPPGASFLFYVMPYVEGESLRDRLSRERQLPLDDALKIAREVADALGYAHGHGIIHRDIKPENILLSGGHARVADFGIARAIDVAAGDRLTETGLAMGTAAYMSPEQAAGESALDGRTDIYSLGCVLYEMLAGQPPFTGPTAQSILARHAVDPVPSLQTVRSTVPTPVHHALDKALAKVPADRFATAAQFAAQLQGSVLAPPTQPIAKAAPAPRTSHWWKAGVAVLLLGVIALAVSLLTRSSSSRSLDRNLIAIAPFDVLDPSLALWREGLVDVLSSSLDGAGALRTVAPSVVIRNWSGRADQPSALKLGRGTGAGLALYGSLVSAGPDSVRLTGTLLDVEADRTLAQVELRHEASRMDRVVDSLAVQLLTELGRTRQVGLLRQAQTRSLPALKAFLQGEQYYRRMVWDSAQVHFERAVALDSTFALALRHLATTHRWRGNDDSFENYALRAARFNHGLPPRESLMVVADSLEVVLWRPTTNAEFVGNGHRIIGMWEEAVRRYPDDPEAWYGLGEARLHIGTETGVTLEQQLEAFDRAIAIDSGFLLAEPHAISLAIRLGGADLGRRYAAPYLARDPRGEHAQGIRVAMAVLQRQQPDSAMYASWTDSLHGRSWDMFREALGRWTDSTETVVRMVREIQTDPGQRNEPMLANWVATRGHVREAGRLLGTELAAAYSEVFLGVALLGAVPAETAAVAFESWRSEEESWRRSGAPTNDRVMLITDHALPWWTSRGDTAVLRRVTRDAESGAPLATGENQREAWRYLAAAARAYLALARRDTAEALRGFLALPDTLCLDCDFDRLQTALLLSATGRDQEAYDRLVNVFPSGSNAPSVIEGLWVLERARVAERLGDRETATDSYRWVAGIWRNGDPELQPYVAEARAGLERMTSESPR